MSTPARSVAAKPSLAKPVFLADSEKRDFLDEFYGLIADRAYSLFEKFGGVHGNDVSQWLQAERELASVPEIEQSDNGFITIIPTAGIPGDTVKVCAGEEQAIISAKNDSSEGALQGTDVSREVGSLYYLVRWPEKVSADSYKAEIRDGKLTLTARKAQLDKTEQPAESTSGKESTLRSAKVAS
jgi:HSP20 family molecular chaperone IbpA